MFKIRKRALGILLIILGILLLVGVVYLGLHYWHLYRPFELYPESDPLLAFKPKAINGAIALLSLAGQDDAPVFEQAVDKGELETAYVTLAFSTSMADKERLGHWLLLARAYAQAHGKKKAILCYGQVYKLAILSPFLSDFERADALLMAAKGLQEIGERERALFVYKQAGLLITRSPYLKKAQRVILADRLKEGYRSLKAQSQLEELEEALASLPETASAPEPLLTEFITLPEENYTNPERLEKALTLSKALEAKPKEIPEAPVKELAEILKEEDKARMQFYDEKLASEERLSYRAGWLWARINWLTLKYRIAVRGFGVSLVPEWEERTDEIRSQLSQAYEALYSLYTEEAVALPQQHQIDRAWVEIYRDEACKALLGLYANAPLDKLAAGLEKAMDTARASGKGYALRIGTLEEGSYIFIFQPFEPKESGT